MIFKVLRLSILRLYLYLKIYHLVCKYEKKILLKYKYYEFAINIVLYVNTITGLLLTKKLFPEKKINVIVKPRYYFQNLKFLFCLQIIKF